MNAVLSRTQGDNLGRVSGAAPVHDGCSDVVSADSTRRILSPTVFAASIVFVRSVLAAKNDPH
jgi:hypothetical protein